MSDRAEPRGRRSARLPWYGEGLRFSCLPGCGACCTKHGDCDWVYLEGDDAERIAAHLGLTREEFLERRCEKEDGLDVLRMDGPDCPFLEGSSCAVYAARPRQCRTFPFWRENLRTRSAWEKLHEFCPGIGAGEPHSLEAIRARLDEESAG